MEIAEGNNIRAAGQTINQIILVGCDGMDLDKFESSDALKILFLDKLPRISSANRFHSIFMSEEWVRSNSFPSLKKYLNHYDRYALYLISEKQDVDILTYSQENLVEDFVEPTVCIPQVLIKLTELAEKKRNYSIQMIGQSHEISLYRRALDQSASAIEITDANGVIVYVNDQFEESSGYTSAELIGQKASIVASGRMGELLFKNLWDTITAGQVWKGEFENRRKDGTLYYQRATIRPVQGAKGEISHFIAVKDDVSSLKENELTKEFIINAANIATWDWNLEQGNIDYNEQWAGLIGYSQQELGEKKGLWESRLHPDDKHRVLQLLHDHLELKSEQYDAIYRLKHKDGHYVWVHDSGKVIATDKNGKATRMAGVHSDVTDLMTTQEALSIERDQLAQTQQVAQTGSCFFDFKQGRFTYFSDVARELVGLPESGDIQFDQILSKIPFDEVEMVKGHYEKMLKGEHIHLFHRVLHDEGFVWLKIDGTPVQDSSGKAIGLLAVMQDVTDLKTQIQTISDQNQKLKEANALAKMGHWKLNLESNTCVWSDQLMIIMGVEGDKNEFTFDEYLQKIHPEDQSKAIEEYQYAYEHREPYVQHHRLVMPDGEIKYTEVRGRFICNTDGVPIEVLGITKDITEEVNANVLNEVQRDRLTAAAEIGRLGYWEFDFSTGQVYWSKELFALLEVDPEKEPANFDRYVDLIHPEDKEDSLKLFSEAAQSGSFKREHRMLLDSGETIYLEESASFEMDQDGNPLIARGVSHDVTEAKLKAIKLEKETEDHNKAQEIAKIGHWKFDVVNGTVDWSNNVYKLWDKDPKTFKPSFETIMSTVYFEDVEKLQKEISHSIEHKTRGQVEHRVAYQDGSVKYFEEQWDVELDSKGEVAYFVGMVLDRTEAIKQKHELEELQQMHSKAQSIAHIGHFRWDIEKDVLEWSDEMFKIWGITKPDRDLVFADCKSAYHPDELPTKMKAIDASIASGQDGTMIHKVIRPDDSERTVEARWQIEFSQKDNRKYLIGTVHDITDAFDQKQALEEETQMHLRAQSIAHIGHFKFNIASQEFEWSDEVYKIWGITNSGQKITFQDLAKLVPSEDLQGISMAIQSSIESKVDGAVIHQIMREDLSLRVVDVRWQVELDENDNAEFFVGTVHDITDSWEINDKLREAEKIALLGHWTLDHITGELFWSDQVYEIFDLKPQEFPATYDAFLSYIHPEDRAMVNEVYTRSVETKSVYELDHRLLVNGEVKYVSEKAVTQYDDKGKPIKSIGTVQDITEKKVAQNKADEASKRLGMLVESIPELIFVCDKEGHYIDYFESAFDQPLVPPEVFMGKHYSEVLPISIAQKVDKFLPLALDSGEVQKFPFQLDKEGVEKWYESTMAPYRDGDEVIGVTIVNRDVTKEKVYENQLVDTKLNLELILKSLDKLLCIIDEDGRYIDVFYSERGIKPIIPKEEILGKYWRDVMPENIHHKIEYAFKLVDKKKVSTDISYSLNINGVKQYFEASVSPFLDIRKNIRGYSVLVSDITDRKKAKKLLKKSEERFKKHSEFLPHILWTRNFKGELTYMNAKGKEYYGKYLKKISQVTNDPLAVIHPQDRTESQKKWNRAQKNKGSFQNLERRKDHKGVYRWFNIKVDPIFDKDGHFLSWIGVATDVDKEQKVAKENEQLVNSLQERVKEAECMYAISHLSEDLNLSLDHIFEKVVDIVPTGFQYPEFTKAQVIYNGKRFGKQVQYRNKRVHELKVRDQKVGEIIVGVSAKATNGQLNFFLKEEIRLLAAIADNLSLLLTQKLDQMVLAESEKRFKSLFNSASIGILIQDLPSLQIVDVNQAMSALLHFDRTDILGLTLLDLSPKYQGDLVLSKEKFKEVSRVGSGGFFWQLLDNYGQNIHCAINVNSIDIEGKQYQVSFIRNVSDEMAAYTALENSEELYRNIFENIQEGYYIRDLEGKIININPEGLKILEAKEEEVVNQSAAKYFFYDDGKELTFFEEDNKQIVHDLQVKALTPDGKEKYLSLNKKYITSNDAPWVVECSFRDITDKVLLDKLQKLSLELANHENATVELMLQHTVDQISNVFGGQYAFLHFVNHKESEVKYSTFSKGFVSKVIPHAIPFEKIGFWHKVIEQKRGYSFNRKEILLNKRNKADGQVNNAMVTPIIIKGEVVAVIGVCNRSYDFSEMELNLLKDFGLQFYSIYGQVKTQEDYLVSLDNLERSQQAGKIGAWTYDVVFDETWWSDIMFDLYGIDKSEGVPGDNWVDFTHPDDRDIHIKAFEDAFASGNFECEYRLITPKGEMRHLKAMADIKRDENGAPVRFNGFVQDVTAIKLAEEAIIEEKQKFENIVDALPGIVYRLSLPEVSLEYASEYTQDLLGIPSYLFASAKGEDFILSLVHPDDWEEIRKIFTRAVEEVDTYSLIHRMKKDDGKYVWVSNTGKVSLAGDDTYDVEGFIYDVTDRIKNEERIMNAVMEASDKEKSRISKEIHDSLQQTLTIASLNLEFVRKEKENLSNKARDKFKTGWTYLKKSMDDSRSIAHRLMPKAITDFGVVPVLKDMFEELNRSGDVEFEFITNFEDRIKIPAATNVYKVVQEAVNNILKHADAKTVTVQYLLLDGLIQLSIEDDGCGFDITQVGKKSSFGLASMKSRATALSAELLIDSHPGHGTTLVLEIPYNENIKYYE